MHQSASTIKLLIYQSLYSSALRCPVVSDSGTLAVDPLGPVGWRVGPPWINVASPHFMDAWSDWDLGSLEIRSKPWVLCCVPWAIPEGSLQCYMVHLGEVIAIGEYCWRGGVCPAYNNVQVDEMSEQLPYECLEASFPRIELRSNKIIVVIHFTCHWSQLCDWLVHTLFLSYDLFPALSHVSSSLHWLFRPTDCITGQLSYRVVFA